MLDGKCLRVAVVIPTIRREALQKFLQSLRAEFGGYSVIVVGADSWIIPRRTDCIRSFGSYEARVRANPRKELPGCEINESLWQAVDAILLESTTFAECYRELADGLLFDGDYWKALRRAMRTWAEPVAQPRTAGRAETASPESHA